MEFLFPLSWSWTLVPCCICRFHYFSCGVFALWISIVIASSVSLLNSPTYQIHFFSHFISPLSVVFSFHTCFDELPLSACLPSFTAYAQQVSAVPQRPPFPHCPQSSISLGRSSPGPRTLGCRSTQGTQCSAGPVSAGRG